MGKEEDFINHRLHSDFYGLHTVFFEQEESPFIQGVGSCGDADRIDQPRSEERLNFLQITDLIISMDCGEAPTIKSYLFFSKLFLRGKFIKGGFNEVSDGRGRKESFARSLLITEETTLMATHSGKKNGNNQWVHWVLLE
jgi:hypothetical protein